VPKNEQKKPAATLLLEFLGISGAVKVSFQRIFKATDLIRPLVGAHSMPATRRAKKDGTASSQKNLFEGAGKLKPLASVQKNGPRQNYQDGTGSCQAKLSVWEPVSMPAKLHDGIVGRNSASTAAPMAIERGRICSVSAKAWDARGQRSARTASHSYGLKIWTSVATLRLEADGQKRGGFC